MAGRMAGMKKRISRWTLTTLSLVAAMTVVSAQSPVRPPGPPQQGTPATTPTTPSTLSQDQAIFRATANYVYNDVRVVDAKGQFVPDLKPEDFKIYEDGVEQKLQYFQVAIGGRTFSTPITFNTTPTNSGLILPTAPPVVDASGRIFVIFIDDLHLQVDDTARAKQVLYTMRDNLLHDGDQITIVGTGYSGIEGYSLMYYYAHNHARLDEAINKLIGSGMSPEEVINATQTESGPAGLRYNMDTAFRTADDILSQLGKFPNRRKAFIYLSSGYDLDPFKDSRLQVQQQGYDFLNAPGNQYLDSLPTTPGATSSPPGPNGIATNPFASQIGEFSETDLMRELAELIRTAKRADTAFYTVDPRGLVSSLPPGMNSLSPQEWQDFVQMSTDTLRVLAEQTGGIAGVNTNDFKSYFKRVDADFSDYYEIGYTSSDIDPTRRLRKIQIKTTRPGLTVTLQRDSYEVKSVGEATPKPKAPRIKK
jgi:VWFA-related protein